MTTHQTTRELLQKAFQEAAQKNLSENQTNHPADEASSAETHTDSPAAESSNTTRTLSEEIADFFDELPADFKAFLENRKDSSLKETEHLKQKIADIYWLDHLFSLRDKSISSGLDESPREWVEKMAYIEHMLCAHPRFTLDILAHLYLKPASCSVAAPMTLYYQRRCEENARQWLSKCLSRKDENNSELYPYQKQVVHLILALLNAKMAPDIQKAYEMAVWMDDKTRPQMIEAVVNKKILEKADEAREAREKSFAAKGFSGGSYSDKPIKSTRELLEEAFRKYRGEH